VAVTVQCASLIAPYVLAPFAKTKDHCLRVARISKLGRKEFQSSTLGGSPPATSAGFLCPNLGHDSGARAVPRREGG